MNTVHFSVVIPIKDEEENVELLFNEIEPVMKEMGKPWELIFIDDGSTDSSAQKINSLINTYSNVRMIQFDQNYGQTSGFDAGFKEAQGEFIITLDGDRQNDPRDIPKLVELTKTSDLVCGIRANRKDTFVKKIVSKIANFVRGKVCQDKVQDTGCSLKIYRKKCLDQIKLFDGMHRFLPALFVMESFTIAQTPVNHRERSKGVSKYGFSNRLIRPIADMFAVFWMRRRRLKYKTKI